VRLLGLALQVECVGQLLIEQRDPSRAENCRKRADAVSRSPAQRNHFRKNQLQKDSSPPGISPSGGSMFSCGFKKPNMLRIRFIRQQ
jgi:hypothetical protein